MRDDHSKSDKLKLTVEDVLFYLGFGSIAGLISGAILATIIKSLLH